MTRPWLVALALAACVRSGPSPRMGARTVILIPAQVRTLDPARPAAQAIALRDGTVLATGSVDEVRALAGADAVEEVLPGATIVPGLVDAHVHLASLGRALSSVRCTGATSASECVQRAKAAPKTAYQGDWLVGRGWDQNDWPGQAFPSKALLDEAFPSTPVWLTRIDGHAAWANSKALALAGIGKDTQDPPGGRIVRDAKGEPTGVLVDNAMDVVTAVMPAPSEAQALSRLKLAVERCLEVGLTGVHDAGMDPQTFALLQSWDAVGALPLRVYAMADGQSHAELYLGRGRFEGRHLRMQAVKLLADGALGSRGAALEAPYSDAPKELGLMLLSEAELESRAKAFAAQGFQVAIHAIGDRANHVVLDVLERLERAEPGRRHRVEHAQVLRPQDVKRFAASNLVASFQPTHCTSDAPWAGARLGPERERFAYAWRSVLDSGAHVAFGSDFPIEEPEPLAGLYAARTRQDAKGQPAGGWHPEQRVTGEEALEGFTAGAAWAEHAETRRGRLVPGFDADLTVLSVDPVSSDALSLLGARVLLTMVSGVDVWRAPELR